MPRREGEVLRLGTAIEGTPNCNGGPGARGKEGAAHTRNRAARASPAIERPLQAAPLVSNAANAIASRGPRYAHKTNWNAW